VQSITATSAARSLAPRGALLTQHARLFHASPAASAETVKVPQMAESISEGTLKQWSKKKGDFVNADEEVATIETDKVSAM
jgi:2-oxoglutarate dehydrogenase E2 component (dihydrolipoamide succinyltransferase)